MTTHPRTLAGLALLAAAALPLAVVAPAQASTTHDGCTVSPQAPYFAGTWTAGNVPEVFYPYTVTCTASTAAMSVEVTTKTMESDLAGRAGDVDADGVNNADDESVGSATTTSAFTAAGGTKTVKVKGVLPHTDTDANEEVYHKVRFRVTSGAVTGTWTAYELTAATRIWW